MANVEIILGDGVEMPEYATEGAAALDLRANIKEPITLVPGETQLIPTGVHLNMSDEPNLCAEMMPRSGLGSKHGLVLANTIGLIDNDYQGELMIMAFNRNAQTVRRGMGVVAGANVTIEPGMRIAQLKFSYFVQPTLKKTKAFKAATKRADGGLGSTGTK